jgi:hypothetical protein
MDVPAEIKVSISEGVRARLVPHLAMVLGAWPLFSFFFAAIELGQVPYHVASWTEAVEGALLGVVLLTPDFLVFGAAALTVTLGLFSILAAGNMLRYRGRIHSLLAEPFVLFLSVFFGSVLHYPIILNHPAFVLLSFFPIWAVTVLLGLAVALLSFIISAPGARIRVTLSIMAIGLLSPLPASYGSFLFHPIPAREKAPLVLLGLDSLSHQDDLAPLRNWIGRNKGTWYSHAVTPGLLTNSVWVSLITMVPVHEHGVFHVFQPFPAPQKMGGLIQKAQLAGYRTIAVFPDQLTCWIGEEAGFDENRSGPVGWRQLVTPAVENASLLLPLFRPLFSKLPFSATPPNHAGVFTYDLGREFEQIFSAGSPHGQTFVAAHSTYLHIPAFPRYSELSWEERLSVMRATVHSVRDRSFDWQDVTLDSDPLDLHRWKVRRLQKMVEQAVVKTRFLSVERGGRLVLFSDHGDRAGITADNFGEQRYLHVLLATFGLPSSLAADAPISLLEIGSLLGLDKPSSHFDPIAEFTLARPDEWHALANSAQLKWDGTVELDEGILASIFKRLRSFRPWPAIRDEE